MSTRSHHVAGRPLPAWNRMATAAAGLALLSVVSGCGRGTGGPAPGAKPRPVTTTAAVASRELGGHGELAFVAHGSLFLTGGPAGKLRRVRLPGLPSAPAWSADHRWLAVQVSPSPQPATAALWIVDAAGTSTRKLTPSSWDVSSFAWSPRSSRLAVAAGRPDTTGVVAVVTMGGARKVLAAADGVSGVAWSPSGGQIAAGVAVHLGHPGWQSSLELLAPAGGPPRVVTARTGTMLELAGWWPDGSGLLFWADPGDSSSIAADGLPLGSVSLSGHGPRHLATTLVHTSWLAFSPDGHTVAVAAGGDRVIWAGNKRITRCRATGGCTPVAQPPGVVSLDPSWSPDGTRLVFARASASGPFGANGHADFSPYWIRRWQATSRLWVSTAGGSSPKPLAAAGPGALDPVCGSDGSLLFVRDDSVWLLPPGAAGPVRVTGPLGAVTAQAYYGYVPYPRLMAWTLARLP